MNMQNQFGMGNPAFNIPGSGNYIGCSSRVHFKSLTYQNMNMIYQTFIDCGVIFIENFGDPEICQEVKKDFVEDVKPIMDSRTQLLDYISTLNEWDLSKNFNETWERQYKHEIGNSLYLNSGTRTRERHHNRLDFGLPIKAGTPVHTLINQTLLSGEYEAFVKKLLGEDGRIKSAHIVKGMEGCGDQKWHR